MVVKNGGGYKWKGYKWDLARGINNHANRGIYDWPDLAERGINGSKAQKTIGVYMDL